MLYLLQRSRVCWVFPEPVFTPGTNSVTGVHARFYTGSLMCRLPFPLEPPVQGRKHITAQAGDAAFPNTSRSRTCEVNDSHSPINPRTVTPLLIQQKLDYFLTGGSGCPLSYHEGHEACPEHRRRDHKE